MDWFQPIDAYCERTDPSFWAEPLNAVSNLSFLAAMIYGLGLAFGDGRRDGWTATLAATAGLVGIGSFLFHTVATRWAALADVVPIALFIALGFALVMRRLAGASPLLAVLATALFMAASVPIGGALRPMLGSSAAYGPALAALLLVGGMLHALRVAGGGHLLAAGAVFGISILFRMADMRFCDAIPFGTHVGWHLLNGLVLALVLRAVATPGLRGAER